MPSSFTRWPWWRRWFRTAFRMSTVQVLLLAQLGYRILARNLSDSAGELDLLVLDGQTIVVVEVRSSENANFRQFAQPSITSNNAESPMRLCAFFSAGNC